MKQNSLRSRKLPESPLQHELSAGILDFIRTEKLQPGTRLGEVVLAEHLQVSRTPVRAALKLLARRGLVRPSEVRGFVVAAEKPAAQAIARRPTVPDVDRLFLAI